MRNNEPQIILEGKLLIVFQEVIHKRIELIEQSIPYSIELAKKKYEKDMRKKRLFRKPFVSENEEITEAHLEDYISKYVQVFRGLSFRGERTPSQIREYAADAIEHLKIYLVNNDNKYFIINKDVSIIMSLEIYNLYMNNIYTGDFFLDIS